MPDPQHRIAAPSMGWRQRLFGSPAPQDPDLNQAWQLASTAFPEGTGNVTAVEPMGTFAKWFTGNAPGATNPITGRIQINKQHPDNPVGIMIHEMEHAKQGIPGFFRNLFTGKGEVEAANREGMRTPVSQPVPQVTAPTRPPTMSLKTRKK